METIMKIEYYILWMIMWTILAMRLILETIELESFKVLPTKEGCIELIQSLD